MPKRTGQRTLPMLKFGPWYQNQRNSYLLSTLIETYLCFPNATNSYQVVISAALEHSVPINTPTYKLISAALEHNVPINTHTQSICSGMAVLITFKLMHQTKVVTGHSLLHWPSCSCNPESYWVTEIGLSSF